MIFGQTPARRRADAIAQLRIQVAILRRQVSVLESRRERRLNDALVQTRLRVALLRSDVAELVEASA